MNVSKDDLEKEILNCLHELSLARDGKYDGDKSERSAAMFLSLQIQLADYLSSVELKSRSAKNEITRLEAEKYFEIKLSAQDRKITEVALGHAIVKDENVISLKRSQLEFEIEFKKWQYILNTLKDGHIFFRGLSKKNEF